MLPSCCLLFILPYYALLDSLAVPLCPLAACQTSCSPSKQTHAFYSSVLNTAVHAASPPSPSPSDPPSPSPTLQPGKKEFEPDQVPVYCSCELPYNPDKPMLMCEQCEDW